ncbi:MAG: NAD(P)/FAD-dependent oxidoreductase [Clostridia bacterium]|nr:NAD(P)/FAD-dependent oxidoreductase [Clostridia bacterium]
MEKEKIIYDCIIVGKGPSGLSCALYTQRANLKTLIIGKDGGSMYDADIENFFGVKQKIKGAELIKNTCSNLGNLGAKFCDEFAIKFEQENNLIKVDTETQTFYGKYMVIATGKSSTKIIKKNGVSYCATCDGFFYKNKIVGVKGDLKRVLEEANYLKNICQKVYILADGKNEKLDTDLEVIDKKIEDIIFENDTLSKIKFADSELKLDGLFICENVSVNSMQNFGIITKNDFVKVNENYQTNIKNIFAIGDIIGYPYQVAKAVYDGMMCAMSIIKINQQKI